ncbi:glycosyltransferase [Thalassotalea agarivorans]|uniref:Glycosyltransferase involved in cell wall bisynthesis n=1 Tax=Thalassotalea agarivorans TaxID=349064 RepID=A0A1I0DYN1_THASX|nr:glycosyltransferase [Thalassotalea agarivorans]SET36986.1 Glycosyltransferase involved in cell wall bisynthesis [Thalassotalea agarivorans]
MKSNNKVIILTNLYPSPWEPNRATFNKQQFDALSQYKELHYLVPVPFLQWFKKRKQIKQTTHLRYAPFFYVPGTGRRFNGIFMTLSLLFHSGRWIKASQADTLLACWAYPDGVAGQKLAHHFKLNYFLKIHGSDIHIHGLHPSRSAQIKQAANKASGIVSVSNELKQSLAELGVEANKISVLYNGVNHALFQPKYQRPCDFEYIIFVGNLKHDKGIIEYATAFDQFAASNAQLHCVVIGDGPDAGELRRFVDTLQHRDRFHILGSLEHHQIAPWVQHAKCLCLPSYHEGVPNVLLESMAIGTPVISTLVGGIPEVVLQNETGLLIKPQNSVQLLAALDQALSIEWNQEAIRKHAEKFCWQSNAKQLQELISTR